MKKILLLSFLALIFTTPAFLAHADGIPDETPVRRNRVFKRSEKKVEEPVPAPVCVSQSEHNEVKLVSWDPKQKVSKFLGSLQECVTTQWDVLRILSGPNTIGLHYPDEKEMWGYVWLWSYDLNNPLEETVIMMDDSGKRIRRGKNPVEIYLTFNAKDVLERVEMVLVKKSGRQYSAAP